MSTTAPDARRRLSAVLREESRVTPLELVFDLAFIVYETIVFSELRDRMRHQLVRGSET